MATKAKPDESPKKNWTIHHYELIFDSSCDAGTGRTVEAQSRWHAEAQRDILAELTKVAAGVATWETERDDLVILSVEEIDLPELLGRVLGVTSNYITIREDRGYRSGLARPETRKVAGRLVGENGNAIGWKGVLMSTGTMFPDMP